MPANRIRTCIGCRTKKSKYFMRRLGVDDNGSLVFDEKHSLAGRGGYVCFDEHCMLLALRRKDLCRIFKKSVKHVKLKNLCAQGEVRNACQK